MDLTNWNKNPKIKNVDFKVYHETNTHSSTIPRGFGNSYGDASLGSCVTSMVNFKYICEIEKDVLTISSGYSLKEALLFVMQRDFIIPSFPGTQHVSIGGMVAADVHGKNHLTKGTIGNSIISFDLQTGDHNILTCSRTENEPLFNATIGGMGLTGIILTVRIKLDVINGTTIFQKNSEFSTIKGLLEGLKKSESIYKIAWIDIKNSNNQYFLLEGDFTKSKDEVLFKKPKGRMPNFGISILNPFLIKIYNKRYANKLRKKPEQIVSFSDYFFPIDSIKNSNNAYGIKGFYQYQFVIPLQNEYGISKVLNKIEESHFTPYLISLKQFGKIPSPGMLSFPCEGFSLAIDFKNSKGIEKFIQELDTIVLEEKGRVYLAKDALLSETTFTTMYPNSESFKNIITKVNQGKFVSLLAKRLNLVDKMKKVIIIGANSDIGMACANQLYEKGLEVILAAHKPDLINDDRFQVIPFNIQNDPIEKLPMNVDIVLYVAGKFSDNKESLETSIKDAELDVNFAGPVKILSVYAKYFNERGHGTISGVTSIAAVRGKSSTVVYGASKAGFDSFLSGLRGFYHPTLNVLNFRLGYVDTKMTASLNLPGILTASKESVANTIVKHSLKGNRNIIYAKAIWRPIAFIIKNIPEGIFKRLKL
jgi:short-subunit dehydrogenase